MSIFASILRSVYKLSGAKKAFSLPEDALRKEIEKQNRHRGVFTPTDRKAYYETIAVNGFPCLIVREHPKPSERAILYFFGGGLGLRRSEALGVRWSRIDWDKKTVLLDTKIIEYKANGKTIIEPVEEMKNKSSRRTLPLPEPVLEMLSEEKEKQTLYRKMFKGRYNRKYDDFVCVNKLGDLIRPSYVTQHFSDLLKKYGLRHIRFHDLRHTFASILIGQDVPLINVSNFLGHSDLSTTANIYAHLDKASKQASADIMTDILNMGKS